jgi:predicted FMN-binding regulatory protein PaiB
MRQLLLHYARVKIHNIPNCYWQGLAKYDILCVTQKAGSFSAPDWYRERADTGADRPCFCVAGLPC